MAYYVYLDDMELPIAPSKIETKINNQNKTINLIDGNEINVLKQAGLTEISLSPLFPQTTLPFANGVMPISFYLTKLQNLKTSKQPFRFIVSRMTEGGKVLFKTDINVSLESYSIIEDAGNGLAVVVDINLKQYRDYKTIITRVKIKEKSETATGKKVIKVIETKSRATTKKLPNTYTVKPNDTLWNICKKELNDGSKYKEVAQLNDITNPNLILSGQVIRLA